MGLVEFQVILFVLLSLKLIKRLRANVTNGQTFGGNRSKTNSAHILLLGRP